jgi:hypothetical protein
MGQDYSGVMFFGIELTTKQEKMLVKKYTTNLTDDEIDDFYFTDLEIPHTLEVKCVDLAHSYDGDRHDYLVISSTYFISEDYGQTKIKKRFTVDYDLFDKLLSNILSETIHGSWYIMSRGR